MAQEEPRNALHLWECFINLMEVAESLWAEM
jgi:hypothetical protein